MVEWLLLLVVRVSCGRTGWPGRRRVSQVGAHQAARPVSRRMTGSKTSRTRKASSSTATPRMTPISFGGRGLGERKREEHGDHHPTGREDHSCPSAPTPRPWRSWGHRTSPSALSQRPAGRPCSPSRSRRSWRRRRPAPTHPGSPAARIRAGRRPCPSWKIRRATPNAAAVDSKLATVPRSEISGARSASSNRRNPRASTTPMTSGVESSSRVFEVGVLGCCTTDQRRRPANPREGDQECSRRQGRPAGPVGIAWTSW